MDVSKGGFVMRHTFVPRFMSVAGAVTMTAGLLAVWAGPSSARPVAAASVGQSLPDGTSCSTPVQTIDGIPFTGSETFEVGFADAINLPALYEINANGGIMCHQEKMTFYDDRSDAADALVAFDRELALNPSISWTQGDTTTTPVLLPVATRYKLPFLSAAGLGIYDKSTNPYFYRYAPPDPANGEAMAVWAQRKGYTRVATLFGTDAGSQGDLPGVINGLKAIHAKLVTQINIVPDQPNYRTDVERLLASKPQAIMTESDGPTASTFFSELKQLGSLVPIIGTSGVPSESYIGPLSKAIGTANFAKDFVAVVIGVPNPSAPAYKIYANDVSSVRAKLEAPWQQWVGNPYTLNGYSSAIIFALAMDWAHSTVGSVFNKYIPMVTAPGKNKVVVNSYKAGVAALKAGKSIQYVGALGPMVLNKYHNWFPDEAVQTFSPSAAASVVGVVTTQQIQKLG